MNIEKNTKQKIIEESLKLFSEKGYEGVSMREIASAVGIKGASIYNHFKGCSWGIAFYLGCYIWLFDEVWTFFKTERINL